MLVGLNAILHMFVDGICAYAMFGYFKAESGWYINMLLYNFCAFALQMPFGFAIDLLETKKPDKKYITYFVTFVGVMLTVLGVWTHPVVLGIGNALFHIGGGIHTIRRDLALNQKGRLLGIFVAPGALGLFLGKKLGVGAYVSKTAMMLFMAMLLIVLLGLLFLGYSKENLGRESDALKKRGIDLADNRMSIAVLVLCFVVVIVRSHVTLAMSFDWNTTTLYGLALVLAAVLGKVGGGLFASFFKKETAIISSLVIAAICFGFGGLPVFGVAAVFFFNMTMPITLYELVQTFPGMEGGMFGVLTFALFLGFVPSYLNIGSGVGCIGGCVAAAVSLILLLAAVRINSRRTAK